MLTRLEVHGFKNLLDVHVDFGPFTCIAGANGIGKSNVFDVIDFLSHLADKTFGEAAMEVRGLGEGRGGDPRDLFWDGYHGHPHVMKLAVEMLVPRHVEDDLGSRAEASTTFLRYELELEYEDPVEEVSVGKIRLVREDLRHITKGDALRHLRFPHEAKSFRESVVQGQRRGGPFLSTEVREAGTVINVHGDGGSRGRPQPRAAGAGRTVLSTVTTADNPTILAARREMQSWRRLALEPSALRRPDSYNEPRILGEDGRHVAATLYRIANKRDSTGQRDPEAVYSRVAGRLSDLAGVGVESLEVEPDPVREVFTLFLIERGGLRLPARALSEGTLRFLALCVLLEDSDFTGVICMEEPENGIHPANLPAILELVQDLAVDPTMDPGEGNPFRQVLVNTHSPHVVQLCNTEDLLLANSRRVTAAGTPDVRALTLSALQGSWRARDGAPIFSTADVVAYLAEPEGAQLRLPFDMQNAS